MNSAPFEVLERTAAHGDERERIQGGSQHGHWCGPGRGRARAIRAGGEVGTQCASVGSGDGNHCVGLSMIDMIDAALSIVGLGTNDWQSKRTTVDVKANRTTLVRRQRPSAAGRAVGDVLVLVTPQPHLAALQPVVDHRGNSTVRCTTKRPVRRR